MSTYDADDLLSDATLNAAVVALASRNAHHLQNMAPAEQAEAAGHWRSLAMDVLVAARATVTDPTMRDAPAVEGAPGRAVIVLEDTTDEQIAVNASFHPELQDVGDHKVVGTPAQLRAIGMLETLGDPAEAPAKGAGA